MPFVDLPPEVKSAIFDHLDQIDLLNLLVTSKEFCESCQPALWQNCWIDTLEISGFRDTKTITTKQLGDYSIYQPVQFVHERKRRYMVIGRKRLRQFCSDLERGRYIKPLSYVRSLTVSTEYTLSQPHVMGTLAECDEFGLVHWLIEELPQYFTNLLQLEIISESTTETEDFDQRVPAVAKFHKDVPTNLFLTIDQSRFSRLPSINFNAVKVLRLELTFQERPILDLVQYFKGTLPSTIERLDLVNYAETSLSAESFVKFVKDCHRLASLTLYSPVSADVNRELQPLDIPSLSFLNISMAAAPILNRIRLSGIDNLSVEAFSFVGPSNPNLLALTDSLGHCRYLKQLLLLNVSYSSAARIIESIKSNLISLTIYSPLADAAMLDPETLQTISLLADQAKLFNLSTIALHRFPLGYMEGLGLFSDIKQRLIITDTPSPELESTAVPLPGYAFNDEFGYVELKPHSSNTTIYKLD
ncbi:hypothetical protein TRVA0_031S00958 [Trichomonascus vanleenenianus]|uniref:uncharacterized protein n=1 Tax=Trichomonascus vanleenenianus TaxID=2268995 RepID=UPI003ECB01AA